MRGRERVETQSKMRADSSRVLATFTGEEVLNLLIETNGFVPRRGEDEDGMWKRLEADFQNMGRLRLAESASQYVADMLRLPLAAVDKVIVIRNGPKNRYAVQHRGRLTPGVVKA